MEAGLNNFRRQMTQGFIIGRPGKGHDTAIVGRDRRLVEADIGEIVVEFAMAAYRFILLQEAYAVLGNENSAGVQATFTASYKSAEVNRLSPGPIGFSTVGR